jgi:hypothetical protein
VETFSQDGQHCEYQLSKLVSILMDILLFQVKGLTPEEEKAQYGVVKYAAEATIFRMRAYSIALEMNYSVKKINQEIISKMMELGVSCIAIIMDHLALIFLLHIRSLSIFPEFSCFYLN